MKIPLMKLLELIIFKSKKVATSWMGKVGGKLHLICIVKLPLKDSYSLPFKLYWILWKHPPQEVQVI